MVVGWQTQHDVQVGLYTGHKEVEVVDAAHVWVFSLHGRTEGLQQAVQFIIGEEMWVLTTDKQAVNGIQVQRVLYVTTLWK